ncbi:MAG: glycerol-3-phosphate dehydrogenase/oxidase, partial [Propionibacteriaceae bacterium]|nr:glycerol-3-phosphate dehydrogenase/oxidase [Propionibacteriaceae bacterium]
VREALKERELHLTKLAPHLVKPVFFVWPLTHKIWERPYVGIGMTIYDLMGGKKSGPRHRHYSPAQLAKAMPGMDPASNVGGMRLYDSVEDDSRMALMIARTAKSFGAGILCGAKVTRFTTTGHQVTGVAAVDRTTGQEHQFKARRVIAATGVWSGETATWLDEDAPTLLIRPSKGIHIIVDADALDLDYGILMRTEKSVLFVIPWLDRWLIGDTDTEWLEDKAAPVATNADVDYLLAKVNSALARKLTRSDVRGVIAGLRPLVQTSPDADTTKLSREHSVRSPAKGLHIIAGGKYTTYRIMARDAVDSAVGEDSPDRDHFSSFPKNRTADIPIFGAADYQTARADIQREGPFAGLPDQVLDHLVSRHGSAVRELAQLATADPALAEPIPGYHPYLWAEISYACRAEGAMTIRDVLERRTRIAACFADGGESILDQVATVMAAELGWSESQRGKQLSGYRTWRSAEQAALAENSDSAAAAAYARLMGGLPDQYLTE